MSSAFVLKLAIAPCFVAVVTLIGRRSGPAVAGLLASLPVVAGPILGLLVATQGRAFATTSSFAAALGVVPTMVFALVFASRPRHVPAAACLGIAYAAYFVVAFVVVFVPVTLATAIIVPALAWPLVMRVFPIPDGPPETLPALARDLPVRMVATTLLVAAITSLAQRLGPTAAGILTPFPIITAVLAVFTRTQAGPRTSAILLRSLVRGVPSFVAFFLVTGAVLERAAAPVAFVLGTAACLGCQVALVRFGIGLSGAKLSVASRR